MTPTSAPTGAGLAARLGWSLRVRRVGGCIQVAFAAFWLVRGSLRIHGGLGTGLATASAIVTAAVVAYGIRTTTGAAPRPSSPEGRRIERAVTIAAGLVLLGIATAGFHDLAARHSDKEPVVLAGPPFGTVP